MSATCAEGHAPAAAPARVRNPLSRAQLWIGLALVAATAGAWVLMVRQGAGTDHAAAMSPTMGMGALLFLGVWLAMVAAMMFPAVAPMILMYARVGANRRGSGKASAPTSLFVAGYVLVWAAIGLGAYALASAGERLARQVDVVGDNATRLGGLLILTAGAYQFSSLKDRCLTECRSPLAFIAAHWRDGARGAVQMGVHHGLHCAGCCWALMAMLFPLGMMNIVALGAVTAFIYAEKVLPAGTFIRYAAGVGLIAFGLAVLADPSLLPSAADHAAHHHHMAG